MVSKLTELANIKLKLWRWMNTERCVNIYATQ